MTFDDAFDRLLGHEGGYSNHPSDPGGETMWGVTQRVAAANGYHGPMIAYSREQAKEVYRKRYWAKIHADELPDFWRFHLFDAAVNSGPTQAIQWLQRAVDVVDDGILGPATMAAARGSTKDALLRFYGERLDLLTSLPTWGSFGRGWTRRCASNLLNP
jgi:lysozyme family protein